MVGPFMTKHQVHTIEISFKKLTFFKNIKLELYKNDIFMVAFDKMTYTSLKHDKTPYFNILIEPAKHKLQNGYKKKSEDRWKFFNLT